MFSRFPIGQCQNVHKYDGPINIQYDSGDLEEVEKKLLKTLKTHAFSSVSSLLFWLEVTLSKEDVN